MGAFSISPDHLSAAYKLTREEIAEHFHVKKATLSDTQIRSITHAALDELKKNHSAVFKEWGKVTLSPKAERKLKAAVRRVLVSPKSPWKPNYQPKTRIQAIMFQMMRGQSLSSWELLKEWRVLSAVVWKRDPEQFREAKELIQQLLLNMEEELEERDLSDQENFHIQSIIGDLLSLYPYFVPAKGESIKIPQLVNGKWTLAKYRADPLLLTPPKMGSPLVAVGLKPLDDSSPPIIIFKGTTCPTDHGFLLSLLTDINPGASVGGYAFSIGRKKIESWLDQETQQGQNPAVIYGKSLGGALAFKTALHFPNHVEKVMAFGGPGFSPAELKRLHELQKQGSLPEMHLFWQKSDPVPYCDRVALKGVHYYKLVGPNKIGGIFKGFLSHAYMFSTLKNSAIIHLDPSKPSGSWKQKKMTLLRKIASIVVFPILVVSYALYLAFYQPARFILKMLANPLHPSPYRDIASHYSSFRKHDLP